MPNFTNRLNLEKPFQNEVYNVDIFNANADLIDEAYGDILDSLDGLDLRAEKVSVRDSANLFEATNVEMALLENKRSIIELQEELGLQKKRAISIHNSIEAIL